MLVVEDTQLLAICVNLEVRILRRTGGVHCLVGTFQSTTIKVLKKSLVPYTVNLVISGALNFR